MGSIHFLDAVKRGRKGKNIGISTGISKLDSVIFGIQKSMLYTIGADTGAGKSSFAIDVFVYNLFSMLVNVILNIILIPRMGLIGAAWATLISYSFGPIVVIILGPLKSFRAKST